jgi:hypothetical protein
MYAMYYASMLRCWQLVRILVRTNHPYLWVECHNKLPQTSLALVSTQALLRQHIHTQAFSNSVFQALFGAI